MFSGVRNARSSNSAAAAFMPTPSANPASARAASEAGDLREIGARDLAAERAAERRDIDALHHRRCVAAPSGRRQLSRAGQRPTPIGHSKDNECDGDADYSTHGVPRIPFAVPTSATCYRFPPPLHNLRRDCGPAAAFRAATGSRARAATLSRGRATKGEHLRKTAVHYAELWKPVAVSGCDRFLLAA